MGLSLLDMLGLDQIQVRSFHLVLLGICEEAHNNAIKPSVLPALFPCSSEAA